MTAVEPQADAEGSDTKLPPVSPPASPADQRTPVEQCLTDKHDFNHYLWAKFEGGDGHLVEIIEDLCAQLDAERTRAEKAEQDLEMARSVTGEQLKWSKQAEQERDTLKADNARLREALESILKQTDGGCKDHPTGRHWANCNCFIAEEARAALAAAGKDGAR
jgi:hypothetical protein